MSNPDPEALAAYRHALASFDFQYAFSDDHSVWQRGTNALARLHRMQLALDPTGEIWMSTRGAKGHGAPRPLQAQVVA